MVRLDLTFTADELKPALAYIDGYWKKLERFRPHDDGTLIGLPRPYFIPSADSGSGFAYEEIYYWDTFFIAQGLIGTPRQHLLKGLAENLLSMMQRFSIIPNSGRLYHTSHSQPPFLTTLILQVYEIERDKRWLRQSMSIAKEEYRTVWMGTAQPNWRQVFHGLSRYYDINVLDDLAEAESGWDMTTRFDRKALSYLPVDLNALLYKYECDFQRAAEILGDNQEAREWGKRAEARSNIVTEYLWNEEKGCYFDYNYITGNHGVIYSLATFFPMWAGMDTPERAERIRSLLSFFEEEGGLATTASEPRVEMHLPTQWAYPNGWAPLQLIVIEALDRYGYKEDAERIARKWIAANLLQFNKQGEFLEKYNVVDIEDEPVEGVYPSQAGFGWTNAVFVRLCFKYLKTEELPDVVATRTAEHPLRQLVRNPRQALKKVSTRISSGRDRKE